MTTKIQLRRAIDGGMEDVVPVTSEECVMLNDGRKLTDFVSSVENDEFSPTITQVESMAKVGVGTDVDVSANVQEGYLKSAILTGQTLVNLATENSVQFTTASDWKHLKTKQKMLNTTKNYMVKFNSSHDYKGYVHLRDKATNTYITDARRNNFKEGSNVVLLGRFLESDLESFSNICITFFSDSGSATNLTIADVMLIEYQEGMENRDIPYFEGMQSVKLPVLTTSNEDGTKSNILTVNEDVTLRSNGNICDELNLLTGQLTQRIDEDGEVLSQEVVKTVDLKPLGTNPTTQPYVWKDGHIQLSSEEGSLLPTLDYSVTTSRGGQILENTKHIAKQDKRIYDLEMLMINSSVEDAYQHLLLKNDVQVMSRMDETHLNPMRYYMLTRLIEEKMYEETDMLNKLDTFFLYGDISSDQYFELMDKIFNLEEEIYEDEEHSEEK